MKALQQVFTKHKHWPSVKEVCQRLHKSGFQAVLAGGCVRDGLLGRVPKDFDVATDARPDQVESLFSRSVPVGKQFGVVLLPFDGFSVEVATFRRDGPYLDGRHPSDVALSTAEEDAQRRDFTINGLFYNLEKDELWDFVGGLGVLKAKVLRTIGPSHERFQEDKLRLLRAARFVAQLELAVEPKTFQAIQAQASQITVVSKERITTEVSRLLITPGRLLGLQLMIDTGLMGSLFPDFDQWGPQVVSSLSWTYFKTSWEAMGEDERVELALALLLLSRQKSFAEKGVVETDLWQGWSCFRWTKKQEAHVQSALQSHSLFFRKSRLSDRLKALGEESGLLLLDLVAIDATVCGGSLRSLEETLDHYNSICTPEGGLPEPLVKGEDLLGRGFEKGPALGSCLKEIYNEQIEKKWRSKKDAISYLQNYCVPR